LNLDRLLLFWPVSLWSTAMTHLAKPGVTNLQVVRLKLGMSQIALGKLSGVSQLNISLIEQGRLTPTDAERQSLAAALDIPPNALLRFVEPDLSELASQ
jgi:transcriptional regulator with XRE-family HTH domain